MSAFSAPTANTVYALVYPQADISTLVPRADGSATRPYIRRSRFDWLPDSAFDKAATTVFIGNEESCQLNVQRAFGIMDEALQCVRHFLTCETNRFKRDAVVHSFDLESPVDAPDRSECLLGRAGSVERPRDGAERP